MLNIKCNKLVLVIMNQTLSQSHLTPIAFPHIYNSMISNDNDMSQNDFNNHHEASKTRQLIFHKRMNEINASEVNLMRKTNKVFNNSSSCDIKNSTNYNLNPKRKFKSLKLMQTNTSFKSNLNTLYSSTNNKFAGTISAYNSLLHFNKPTSTSNCVSNENSVNISKIKQIIYSISKHQLQSKQEGQDLSTKLNILRNKKFYSFDRFKSKDIRKDKKVFKSMHLENNSKKNMFINLNGKEAISQSNQISNYSPLESFTLRKSLCKRFGLKLMEDDEQEIKLEREEKYIKMFQTPEWVKETRKEQKKEMERIMCLRNKIKNRYYAFQHKVI